MKHSLSLTLFIFLIGFLGFCVFPGFAGVETHGFFSLDYLKGQEQSDFYKGSFQNLRAGVTFSGEAAPNFSYVLELQFYDVNNLEIEQAWVGLTPSDAFHLKAGLYLVPFGKYNQANRPYQANLVKMPLPLQEIYPSSWRDLGIMVEGRIGFLLYSAYLGNGLAESEYLRAGQQFKDNNSDKGKGGSVGFLLGQQVELGISYYWGKYDGSDERSLALLGLDGSWVTKSFWLLAEYIKADIKNPALFSPGKAEGFFVLLRLNLESLQPLVCYESLRYKDSFHGAGFTSSLSPGNGIFEENSGWIVGLVYSVSQKVLFKMEYDFNRESASELKNNVFRAQAVLSF